MLVFNFVKLLYLSSLVASFTTIAFASKTRVYNCRIALAPDFKISTAPEAEDLMNRIEGLEFVAHKGELDQILDSFANMPYEEKQKILDPVLERFRKYRELDEKLSAKVESRYRVFQMILANIHNPYEAYVRGVTDPVVLLSRFLIERGATYSKDDIGTVVAAVRNVFLVAKSNGHPINRVVLSGSLTNGFARAGSDLDLVSDPHHALGREELNLIGQRLISSNSNLKNLDVENSKVLQVGTLKYISAATKLMIEINENGTFLLLYPPSSVEGDPIKVPIEF
ncbi:MAG: hypothetical protein R3A80_02560 [Bdellovibrionota bacterium]